MTINQDFLATQDSDTLVRGDDWDFWFTINDSAGSPINITNWEIWFTQKEDPADVDPGVFQHKQVITATESDPVNGLVKFNIPNSKTINASIENVYYDIQLVNTQVTPARVKTIKYGRIRAIEDRTVAIS